MLFFIIFFSCISHSTLKAASLQNALFYSGVIELYIRPDRQSLQSDLNLLKNYIREQKEEEGEPTVITAMHGQRDGLALYKEKTSTYEDLYYILAEKILTKSLEGISGVHGFYRGYDATSTNNGRLVFPRLEEKNEINILLTSAIFPVILKGNIPDHFIASDQKPCHFYLYTGTVDEKSETITWKIQKQDTATATKQIPFNTFIVLIDPHTAYFESKEYKTQYSSNILLPNLYLINPKEAHYNHFALDVLRYYKPLSKKQYTVTIDNQTHDNVRLADYIN
ncbi:MAG: hypothetical protein E6Q33_01430 [Neisseriales bacterium]|nr:MAG: hypothetical protein E6Q33_01430 [Neisseriales bacterium]